MGVAPVPGKFGALPVAGKHFCAVPSEHFCYKVTTVMLFT